MQPKLFDSRARAQRRDRAFRSGPVLFLHNRAFEDIIERLGDVRRSFSSALLVGSPDPSWPDRLRKIVDKVTVVDPGGEFARAAGGTQVEEAALDLHPGSFDLALAIGTLDTIDDLPGALLRLRFLLRSDSLLIGAISGGETLQRLRQAMRAADVASGAASPHVHPRIEPAALAHLLSAAGFEGPVVDVERVRVSYRNLHKLVGDLRGMGATNILSARSRSPLTRAALAAAEADFESSAGQSRTTELFEILHFAGWTPETEQG